jgi:hypothetical protein
MERLDASKLKNYARMAKILGWANLIFYLLKTLMESLKIIVNPKFQSAVIRSDWNAMLDVFAYLLDIFLRGWVYWFLFAGLSIGLLVLSDFRALQSRDYARKTPEFYEPEEVLRISAWLSRMAMIGAAATLFVSIPSLLQLKETVFSFGLTNNLLSWGIWFLLSASVLLLECGLLYLALRGFAQILRIIMEIEFNTRR